VEQIAAIMTEGQLSSGPAPDYVIDSPASPQDEDSIIAHAIDILRKRCEHEFIGTSDSQVKNWLALSVGELDHEEFGMLMLDSQHRLIERQVISSGTISSAMVYPREVVKAALKCNAAAVVIYHNHPSGIVVESRADLAITNKLINSLKAIEVQVLDHIIVGGGNSMSFAAKGLI
jgi:DNA repair protein RadC